MMIFEKARPGKKIRIRSVKLRIFTFPTREDPAGEYPILLWEVLGEIDGHKNELYLNATSGQEDNHFIPSDTTPSFTPKPTSK